VVSVTTNEERFRREEEFLRLFKKARTELDAGNLTVAIDRLEKAYGLSPDSEGVENLLGILYFRVENYRKAEEIYLKLTKKNPEVFTLRTNLGLIYFKEKRYFDAIRELDHAVRLKPDYGRPHNYLGLVYVELGKYKTAREEFLRAGSRSMARKMENIIAGQMSPETIQKTYRGKEERPREGNMPVGTFIIDKELKRLLDDFEKGKVPRSEAKDAGSVEHIRLGLGNEGLIEATPPTGPIFPEPTPKKAPKEEPYSTFKLGLTDKDTGFSTYSLLTVYFMGNAYSRLGGLIAAEGKHEFSPAKKRYKGKAADQSLGGNVDPIMKISGEGTLLLSSGDKRIHIMPLAAGEGFYVRESSVFSFQSTISWENGTIQVAPGHTIELLQLSGTGDVALTSRKAPVIKEISPGSPLKVKLSSVVGWWGRISPKTIAMTPEKGDRQGELFFIEFSGKGKAIID
jgi:tetratricopeptide (TPR) repeat protein